MDTNHFWKETRRKFSWPQLARYKILIGFSVRIGYFLGLLPINMVQGSY